MRRSEHLNLDQLLSDPLIRLVMSSDAVEETDVRRLMQSVKDRLQASRRSCVVALEPLSFACV